MSWIHSTKKKTAGPGRVSKSEILGCFRDEHEILLRLALLITGERDTAEQSLRKAREIAAHGPNPFPERLTDWVKWVTIKAAISSSRHKISRFERMYINLNCTHSEHLLQFNDSKLRECHSYLFRIDPNIVIAELDPLARAVLVLRTIARASILDCTLRLRLSPNTVLAANCRATTWVRRMQEQDHSDGDSEGPWGLSSSGDYLLGGS
jgi:hypothetical protein